MEANHELVERERELEALERLIEAGDDTVRFAMVEAPAGLGKTALLREAGALAKDRGLRVLSARGSELERDYPFALVGQLLGPLLAAATDRERDRLLAGAATLAAPVLESGPDLLGTSGDETGEARSTADGDPGYAALHGLYWLVANAAGIQPLLLSIDDLHWADAASLRFLSFLEARIQGMPVTLICARRPREATGDDALLERLASEPRVVHIRPRPLSREGVAKLLSEAFTVKPETEFADACNSACAGNPFLVGVLASELRQSGAEPTAAHAASVASFAPAAISRTVLLRLSRLGPEATELAKAAAVLGDEAPVEIAAELASLEASLAYTAARELSRVSILGRGEPLTYVHPIVRAAVYEELTPRARSEAHRRAADLLHARSALPEQVASQLLRAAPQGDEQTVELLRVVARRATTRGAPEAAVAYLRRAVAEPPPDRLRPRLLRELGGAELRTAEPAAAEHLNEALETDTDLVGRGETALELAHALLLSGRPAEAAELLGRMGVETRTVAPELGARLSIEAVGVHRLIPGASGLPRLDEIGTDVSGNSAVAPLLLSTLASEDFMNGRPAGDTAERALADGSLLRAGGPAARALVSAINTLTLSDRFDSAREGIEEGLRLARLEGSATGFATMSTCRAMLRRRLGALADSEADAAAALEASEGGAMEFLEPVFVCELMETQIERGNAGDAMADLERRGMAGEIPFHHVTMYLLSARGRLSAENGELRGALADLEACGRGMDELEIVNPAVIPWRSRAGLVALALGDLERADALADDELALAQRCGVPTAIAIALRARGLVDGGDAAIERLREALVALEGLPPTLERVRVLVDLGAALRRSGHRADALDPLRGGHELARSFGARPLAERARIELDAAGARPRKPLRTGLDALTASERRISQMAVDGLSNAEIAQALFVTVRTVETHLTHAYGKLEVSGRSELSGVLKHTVDA
jgi:DNA-binding CsgD family transcriptional regulator/tetratricopeptide (TPR) repeat protein